METAGAQYHKVTEIDLDLDVCEMTKTFLSGEHIINMSFRNPTSALYTNISEL